MSPSSGQRRRPAPLALLGLLLVACASGPAPEDTGAPRDSGTAGTEEVLADAGPDRAVFVGEDLSFDVGESVGASFLWDFGDGTKVEGSTATHTFAEPGRYAVVLQATGAGGTWKTDTALVSATLAPTDPPPSWSSTVALGGGRVWSLLPESEAVSASSEDGSEVDRVQTCAGPRTLAHDGSTLAVACEEADQLALVDASFDTLLVDLPEHSRPFGVAGRDGTWFVSLQATGQVAEVRGGAVVALFEVGADPRGIALTWDDQVLITHWRTADARLSVLDPSTGEVLTIELPADTGGDSDTTTGGVLNLVEQVVPAPAGQAWYLPGLHANILRGEHVSGVALTFESSLRAVLATVHVSTETSSITESPADRKQFDERGRASAVAPSPTGDRLFVLHPGTGSVSVIDAVTGDLAGSLLGVGTFPSGLALSPDGQTLYVNAWLDRELRAFDVSNLSTNPEATWAVPTVDSEPLSAEALLGKRVFHDASDTRMSRSGYISCAHCHPDGRDDGLTWDFTDRGEGLRNTTSLEGRAGTAMGRLHWSGNFDEVQDFEHDMRGPFGGTGFLSDADFEECSDTLGEEKAGRSEELDAMAAWLETLVTTPPSPEEAPEGGEALFEAAGCAACHPAPLYTDSSTEDPHRHDVGTLTEASGQRLGGTLDGLDTPTLLGAWATGPWLHDGSAGTLEEAIAAHVGATALDAWELATLAAFVGSL